jgi:L-threonylcarbamoyladenylate synthase
MTFLPYYSAAMMLLNTEQFTTSPSDIRHAAALLRVGEIVAFPTETVYGLGAVVWNESAVQKIFTAKERPADNPLIIHCADIADIETIAQAFPPAIRRVAEHFMPGALTILLDTQERIPAIVRAGLPTVAVRIPAHPIAQELIRAVGAPLVAPSANRSGRPSPTQARHVVNDLNGRIAGVIDGGSCAVGIESTVISMLETPYHILRPGNITKADLENFTHQEFVEYRTVFDTIQGAVPAPGMKYRHYAPKAPVQICQTDEEVRAFLKVHESSRILLLSVHDDMFATLSHTVSQEYLSEQTLYEQLRRADEQNIAYIGVYFPVWVQGNKAGLWNRISKAADTEQSKA